MRYKKNYAGIFFTDKVRGKTFKVGYYYKKWGARFTGIFDKESFLRRCDVKMNTEDPFMQINLESV